jgi:hypothetical protein
MNKKNRLYDIWTVLFALFCSAFIFTTCENTDELNTDLLSSKKITLKAFGPNPALRGQKLSFAGTHLDRITKVILPNGIEITDIEVVNDKLIKVLIPQETVEGIVKLVGPDVELSTASELTISEPISISKMSPQPVKAGQTLTIEGDYFNLVDKIVFTDKVEVLRADCKTWTRTKIEVVLPAEAQSGVVTLSNSDEIPLEYQSPEALQVTLPSVNAVLDLTGKKPGETITAPGKDLDLVVTVEMPNGDEAPFSIENSALTFTLPENISDGAIVMIPASGVRVAVANIGVAIPAEIVVTPDKGLRAGAEITITGINMELVTTVAFPGVDAIAPASQSATEIKVTMPDKAVSGDLILNTASGKSVTAEIETLKPDVVAYNPLPAPAGSDVKLQGHNLDLVTTVTFIDNLVVSVTPGAADELTVPVPLNAVSGVVVLTMANGETVECQELEIAAPPFAYLPNPPGPKAEIHAGGVLTLDVENGDKLADVQINGASVKYILDAPKLYIVVPGNAKGDTELKLVSSNGTSVYTIPVIGAGFTETVIWEEMLEITWGDGGRVVLKASDFENVPAGSILTFNFQQKEAWGQAQINNGAWAQIPFDELGGSGTITTNTYDDKSITKQEFVLTREVLDNIIANQAIDGDFNGAGIIIQGSDWIFTKVTLTIPGGKTETVIMDEPVDFGAWANTIRVYKESFDGVRAGTVLKLYYTASEAGTPQFALQEANWNKVAIPDDPNFDSQYGSVTVPADGTTYEIVLTQAILDVILTVEDGWSTTAIILGGQNMTVTKITLLQ